MYIRVLIAHTAGAIATASDLNWQVVGVGSYDYDGSGIVGPAALEEPPLNNELPDDLMPEAAPGPAMADEPPGEAMPESPALPDPAMDIEGGNQVFLPMVVR